MRNVSIVMCQVINLAGTKLILEISLDLLCPKIEVFINNKVFVNKKVQFCSSLENPA